MVTVFRSTLALLATPVLVSCAGGGGGGGGGAETFDRFSIQYREDARGYRYTFDAPADRVLETLPEVYRYLGFPGSRASNSDELFFISPTATAEGRIYDDALNSQYLDCGIVMARPRADTHILQFVLVTRIDPLEAGGTEIEVIIDGRARERAHNMNAVPCRGTGKLEGEIAALLRTRL